MMNITALKKFTLIGILTAFLLLMTTSVVMAGDGPEPGPPGATVPYRFVPPPFIGQNMSLELAEDPATPGENSLFISGEASQVGNSDCTLKFTNVLIAGWEELLSGGFQGISCADLKPRDFMGNSTPFYSDGVTLLNCDDVTPEPSWYIDIMGVGNIVCFDDSGEATYGTARIIFMLSKPK